MEWLSGIEIEINWVFLGIFILITTIQLFYYWYFFSRVSFFRKKPAGFIYPPVSVVISAKNEYLNLQANLPHILEQDYPDFEVIVVNDGSDDESDFLLHDLCNTYSRLKVINLQPNVNFFRGKKFPLSLGIKSASHELLLLTDADCCPASPHWIRNIVQNYTGSKEVVLGYGGYRMYPGLLNKLIRFDTFWVGLQYLGMALAGKPYMGVGRNLSYNRRLFYKTKGFTSHYRVMSGDDDLFINQVANKANTAVEISPESHTLSEPKKCFQSWLAQKSRHLTTGIYYRKQHKWLLGIFGSSQLVFYPLLIGLLLWFPPGMMMMITLALLLVRTISLMIIVKYASKRLNEKKLFLYSPVLDALLTGLNMLFSFSALFVRENKWK